MKWFVTVKPKDEASTNWSNMIGDTIEEWYGKATIVGYSECADANSEKRLGRIHIDGSPLLFLNHFIELRLWHRSNHVILCSNSRKGFTLTRFGAKYDD